MKDFHVRRGAHWTVISLFLAVTGCGEDYGTNGGGGGGGGGPVATTSVTVRDFLFDPESILVTPSATVTWTWAGVVEHNVTFASSAVGTPSNTQVNGTFQRAMPTAAGAYTYQCTIHPTLMNGTATVQ